MASILFASPRSREFSSAGTVLSGAKLYFYISGTTTPAATYQNAAMTVAHSNPVLADTGGLFPAIWLNQAITYDVTLKTAAGATVWSVTAYRETVTTYYPITSAETIAAVTPSDYTYPPGNIRRYGATGTGDDTAAVQTALSLGGEIDLAGLTCSVARNINGSDRYGVYAAVSGTTIRNGTLKRYNSISTYADAYAVLMVGTPNDNAAAATTGVSVTDVKFEGNDTRHSSAGSALTDFRDAIVAKNTRGLKVYGCTFTKIDSAAITFQKPVSYNYASGVYHNTTKNYDAEIFGNTFEAEAHAVAGRSYIHAINTDGIDGVSIHGNSFNYCDSVFGGETTYDGPESVETDTYTPTVSGWSLGAVRRCGRNWRFVGNDLKNSTEVAIYPAGVDVVVTGNTIHIEDESLALDTPIKVRCRGATVSANIISGYPIGVTVSVPSKGVSVTGNVTRLADTADSEAGAVDVNSSGLSAYITTRADFLTHQPMGEITVSGNSINFPNAAATATNKQSAFRIRTDDAPDANYPEGQLIGLVITGNTVKGHNVGVYVAGAEYRDALLSGNTFEAKTFTSSGFAGGTTLNTRAFLQANVSLSAAQLQHLRVIGNTVRGATYLFCSTTGAGGAASIDLPHGVTANRFDYIKNISTADMKALAVWNVFRLNTGLAFLDRTWNGEALENSLADGSLSSNSQRRYTTIWTGAAYRFYTDDAGAFVTL